MCRESEWIESLNTEYFEKRSGKELRIAYLKRAISENTSMLSLRQLRRSQIDVSIEKLIEETKTFKEELQESVEDE